MIFKRPLRSFTLFLRRFKLLQWDMSDCLRYTIWWQWGARHFRVRSALISRPYFSDWEALQDRVAAKDLDAMLIYQLIKRTNNVDLEKCYNALVTETRDKYQV